MLQETTVKRMNHFELVSKKHRQMIFNPLSRNILKKKMITKQEEALPLPFQNETEVGLFIYQIVYLLVQ